MRSIALSRKLSSVVPAVALAVATLALTTMARPAAAAVSCSKNGDVVRVTLGSGDQATIARSSDAITVNGTQCDSATVDDTIRIDVTGASGNEAVAIDLRGGAFVSSGGNEVPFTVKLGAGTDALRIFGTSGDDMITIGSAGINLNDDMDLDVTLTGVDRLIVRGEAGNDTISAAGGNGTAREFANSVVLRGGPDNDTVVGGLGNDLLVGGDGNDILRGRGGDDRGRGGEGDDRLRGGPGDEVLRGGGGLDLVGGGSGSDKIFGDLGDDTLRAVDKVKGNDSVDGGDGSDTCKADEGDTVTNCEM